MHGRGNPKTGPGRCGVCRAERFEAWKKLYVVGLLAFLIRFQTFSERKTTFETETPGEPPRRSAKEDKSEGQRRGGLPALPPPPHGRGLTQGPHGRPHSGQPRGIPLVAAPPYLPSPLPGASRPPRARGEQRTARQRRGDPRCPPEAAASRLWAAPPRGFSTRRRPPLRRRLREAAAVVVAAVPRPPRCRSAPAGCAAPRPPLSSSCRATSSATAPSRRPPGRGEKRLNAAQRPPVPPRPVPLRLFRKRKRRGGRAQAPRRHLGALRSGRHVGGGWGGKTPPCWGGGRHVGGRGPPAALPEAGGGGEGECRHLNAATALRAAEPAARPRG